MDNKQVGIKPILIIAIVAMLIVNLWTTISLKQEMNELRADVNNLRSQVASETGNVRQQISSSFTELSERLDAGASLLSSSETTLGYENNMLTVTVSFTPKEIAADETAYVTIADKRVPAKVGSDSRYTATASIPMTKSISPIVSLESAIGIRQETLDTVFTDQLLSFEYFSTWGGEGMDVEGLSKGFFCVYFYPNYEGGRYYEDASSVRLIIKDARGAEIATVDMEPAPETMVSELSMKFDSEAAYIADLNEYRELTGQYTVDLELTTHGGLTYRCKGAATFENSGNGFGGSGAGSGQIYPYGQNGQ